MRPVTSACALMTRQSGKRGTASLFVIFSVKARGSIGANRPLRCRFPLMTAVTLRATSVSVGAPARNSGSAIGIGCTLPCVMSTRTAAATARGSNPVIRPPAANEACVSNRRRLNCGRSLNEAIKESTIGVFGFWFSGKCR